MSRARCRTARTRFPTRQRGAGRRDLGEGHPPGRDRCARRATAINITTDDLSNPEEFQKFSQAQNQLTQALGQLRTVVENYPQLASQPRFADLMVAIDEANNQINTERVRYNDLARDYNTEIRTFPSSIGANVIHGAKPLEYFEADEGAKANPKVDMSAITGTATPAAAN